MLTSSYPGVPIDLLHTQSKEFFAIYDPAIGHPSEPAFLTDLDHSLRTPPWTGAQWQALCERTRREGH